MMNASFTAVAHKTNRVFTLQRMTDIPQYFEVRDDWGVRRWMDTPWALCIMFGFDSAVFDGK